MKQFLLFDSDGVLVDTEQYYLRASQEILAERGFTLTKELFREISLIRGSGVWDAFPELTDPVEIETMRRQRNKLFNHYLSTEPITMPFVEEVLRELSQSYRMAIVTSALREDFLTVHNRSKLLHYFDFYLTNGDYSRSKPHPDPWITALDRFGASPDSAVVIEDSQRGVTAGIAAKITTVAIPTDLTSGSDFSEATVVLKDITELPLFLQRV